MCSIKINNMKRINIFLISIMLNTVLLAQSQTSSLGNNMPTMLSNESASQMSMGDAMIYCDTLTENGYSDWIIPNVDQLTFAISGGCVIPDSRNLNEIWTRTTVGNNFWFLITLTGIIYEQEGQVYNTNKCRCVR